MSIVTNLIISCSTSEQIDRVKTELAKYSHRDQSFKIVWLNKEVFPNLTIGGKNLECNLFIGAYNYLDLHSLISYLKSMTWNDYESVQIIVKEQYEFKFRIINIFE